MDYRKIGNEVRNLYDQAYSGKYRGSDESEIYSENHRHYCDILKDISRCFSRNISVLDLGCGTGRYFHCLQNAERLIGIDISLDMLDRARNPVKKDEIRIGRINLICANVFEAEIAARSFNFIYSIGVLGEHSPFDLHICNRLFDLLKPGGRLFFTVVDISSKLQSKSLKRRLAESVCPLLPPIFRRKLSDRLKCFYLSHKELAQIMENSKFTQYDISRHFSAALLWKGAHYECIALKV